MPTTTVLTLDGAISTSDAAWPILAYDSQVTLGTMMLWDPSIAAQWPTGVIGGAVAPSSSWKNLGENFADGVQDVGTPPAYDANGMYPVAASSSILWPTGLFDLPPLGFPNFHMAIWGKTPAAPDAELAQMIAGYGGTSTALVGVYGAYASGDTMGIVPRIFGQGSATQIGLNKPFCAQISVLDAGSGARRVRLSVNNAVKTDVTITPTTAANPTERLKIGKGATTFKQFNGGVISRVIMENCTLSGRDPEVARAAEWAAQHVRFAL